MDRFRTLPNYRYYNDNTGVIETQYAKPLRDYTISGNVSGVGDKSKNLLPRLPNLYGYKTGFNNAIHIPTGDYTISVDKVEGCDGFRYGFYMYHPNGARMTAAELGNGGTPSFIKGAYQTNPISDDGVRQRGLHISVNTGMIIMNNSYIDMENPVLNLTFNSADLTTTDADGNEVTQTYSGYWVEFFITSIGMYNDEGKIVADQTLPISIINPQLETGTESTEYEPYGYKIPIVLRSGNYQPEIYNIFVDKPLGQNESVSFKSGKKMPSITLNKGMIYIRVNTSVPPGAVTYQYYK